MDFIGAVVVSSICISRPQQSIKNMILCDSEFGT